MGHPLFCNSCCVDNAITSWNWYVISENFFQSQISHGFLTSCNMSSAFSGKLTLGEKTSQSPGAVFCLIDLPSLDIHEGITWWHIVFFFDIWTACISYKLVCILQEKVRRRMSQDDSSKGGSWSDIWGAPTRYEKNGKTSIFISLCKSCP